MRTSYGWIVALNVASAACTGDLSGTGKAGSDDLDPDGITDGGAGSGTDSDPSPDDEPDGAPPDAEDADAGASDDADADGGDSIDKASPIGGNVPKDFYLKIEAESGSLAAGAVIEGNAVASGQKVVEVAGTGRIDLTVLVTVPGVYNLVVTAGVPMGRGAKQNGVFADDEKQGQLRTDEALSFYAHSGMWVPLHAGNNVLSLRAEWGYTQFDFVELSPIQSDYLEIDARLRNPQASDNAKRLYRFLRDQYGRQVLSGQQSRVSAEVVRSITGKEPAVLGIDLMDYSPSRVARQGAPEQDDIVDGLNTWREGAIVTAAWHWNAPSGLIDSIYTDDQGKEVDASWYRGFYTYATTFDLKAAMAHPSSADHALLIRDIDAIALELLKLRDADVPVLWRPLHEASGAWFWWGAEGPEPYIALWNLMYERLTNHHGLNNLIWVWNGQSIDWYPGDGTVDVVSEDIYDGERNYSSQLARFGQATEYAGAPRLIALSETGALLDPDKVRKGGPTFSWFCTWSGADYVESGVWNEHGMFEKVYGSDLVLTRDELPDLTVYHL